MNSKYGVGDYAGAQEASRKAKTWLIAAVAVGLVIGIIYAIVAAVAASS